METHMESMESRRNAEKVGANVIFTWLCFSSTRTNWGFTMKHRVSSRTNKGFRMESTDVMKKQAELNYGKLGQLGLHEENTWEFSRKRIYLDLIGRHRTYL